LMPWSWSYERSAGSDAEERSQDFPTQSDAETWIGESWRELLESGVVSVVLLEQERVVYGPMGLNPA
ncbi:MAG: hypothetical protein ORN20_00410, partial [Candidatus Nanopelagicales bacterium]|nr:hypothetical protein [Candidatus Nanopelagicales bacterium]